VEADYRQLGGNYLGAGAFIDNKEDK